MVSRKATWTWYLLYKYWFNNKENKQFGLWEQGKRIVWFSEEEVKDIEDNKFDFTTFFKIKLSKTNIVQNEKFSFPEGFHLPKDF